MSIRKPTLLTTTILVVVFALPVVSVSVHAAQGANRVAPSNSIRSISKLNAWAQMLKVQLEIAKLKASIQKVEASGTKRARPPKSARQMPNANLFRPVRRPVRTHAQSAPLPKVQSVYGFGNHLSATISLNGGTIIVHPGDPINGGQILQVSPNRVTAKIHGRRVILPWSTNTGASPGGVSQGHPHSSSTSYGMPYGVGTRRP